MKQIFYNKWLTRGLIALTLVLVVLLIVLITILSQLASLKTELANLERLTKEAQTEAERLQKVEEYRQSYEYVWQWAIEHGMVNENDNSWIPSN
jgi:cell division protein FtsL